MMGVRTASRSKRPKVDLWSVAYHLPHPVCSAQTPPGAPGAALPLLDDPAVLREQERLRKRRELIGQNVRIPREWADALNPSSPVALQPRFRWLAWAGKSRWHDELRWMKWATVLDSGEVLKAYSERGLETLRDTVLRLKPTMEHFGLIVPAFYQNHGRTWAGGCSFIEEFEGISIPQVICLSTLPKDPTELHWSLAHELAHLGDTKPPTTRRRSQSRYDYQRSLHSVEFQERFGRLLAWHLEHEASPEEAEKLRRWAREDVYAAPKPSEGRSWTD